MNQKMNFVKALAIQLDRNRKNSKLMKQMMSKIELLKCDEDDEVFWESFSEIMGSSNYFFPEIREMYISNSLFPKEPKDMDKGPTLRIYNDFYTEFRWMIFLFSVYSNELSVFVEKRKLFDTCVLFGEYIKALDILQEIESQYGVSFWLLESKMFIYNKLGKSVSEIFEGWPDCESKVIVSYYELKLQENRTYEEYQYFVDKEISRCESLVSERPFLKELIPYYNYRISSLTYELNEANIFSIR